MSLPNAYIIGVQKAGTTSLHSWLQQHPDIYGPEHLKDVNYLAKAQESSEAKKILEKDFEKHNGESIVLHSQVNYIFYPQALKKIKEITPNAKLIIMLRNPEDRAISAYRYFKKMGREYRDPKQALLYKSRKIVEFSKDNNDFTYIEHGFYAQQIEEVFHNFDSTQVMILSFNDFMNRPKEVLEKTFTFLKVDPSFNPNLKTQNMTGEPTFKWFHKWLTTNSNSRKQFMNFFVDWWMPAKKRQLLRHKLIDANTSKNKDNNILYDDFKYIRERLIDVYREDQMKLQKQLKTWCINNQKEYSKRNNII